MPSRPRYYKSNPSDAPIMILTLTSDTLDTGKLYDIASTRLAQRLSQIEGVSEVSVGGGSLPAVRVELNPSQLFNRGFPSTVSAKQSAMPTCCVRRIGV